MTDKHTKILGESFEMTSKNNEETDSKVDFRIFIFSLTSSSLISLGEMPNPETNSLTKDLNFAKQNIDILEMLSEKTKNNLTEDEEKLLKTVIYDLKLKYVEATKNTTS